MVVVQITYTSGKEHVLTFEDPAHARAIYAKFQEPPSEFIFFTVAETSSAQPTAALTIFRRHVAAVRLERRS
jgi:hypothetical protein